MSGVFKARTCGENVAPLDFEVRRPTAEERNSSPRDLNWVARCPKCHKVVAIIVTIGSRHFLEVHEADSPQGTIKCSYGGEAFTNVKKEAVVN